MPCSECSMLGYGMMCQDYRRSTTTTPLTPPSSPACGGAFSFDFTMSLTTALSAHESHLTAKNSFSTMKQSHYSWSELEVTKPSTKRSRFSWSDEDLSHPDNTFNNSTANTKEVYSSISEKKSELLEMKSSVCIACSMVPYGATCTNCNRIQTSKAIALATPPATTWPVTNHLGSCESTKTLEEELLRNLDTDLFEQIDLLPHELDEWGHRVYNDCGHRILYYQNSDGNTITGYEAWYPSSVLGDYEEEPADDDWRSGREIYDSAVVCNEEEAILLESCGDGNGCIPAECGAAKTVITGYEAWCPDSETDEDDDVPMLGMEQRRFAEFLAAQDDELPRFSSDKERIAAWIATSSIIDDGDDDDVSVLDLEATSIVPQRSTFEGFEFVPPPPPSSSSRVDSTFCADDWVERWYGSMSVCV